MNSVALIGRLTRNPEVRWTQDQMAIATFSIAIDRPPRKDGTKETDFPRITVFGRQAENCEKYLKKGRLVGITGRIQTGSYEKDGQTHYTTDVVADRVEFLEWGEKEPQPQPQPTQQAAQHKSTKATPQPADDWPQQSQMPLGFEAINDDDIPF